MINPQMQDFLKSCNLADIDKQIDELKQRIKEDQQEIVSLSVIRKGIQRAREFRSISDKKANEAINEAIAHANGEKYESIKTNSEGAIR